MDISFAPVADGRRSGQRRQPEPAAEHGDALRGGRAEQQLCLRHYAAIVPIVAARCMSTAPTMASGFLNIPVPIIPKFRVGHYALHNTVSMRVLF